MQRLPIFFRSLSAGGALALLSACATTPAPGPVEVTRFHRMSAPAANLGTIRLVIAETPEAGPQDNIYAQAVAHELERIGFRILPAANTTTTRVARLTLLQERHRPERNGSRVAVGGAGTTGTYGSGVGLGLSIDLSGPPAEQIATRLSLTIDDAASGERLWEGRAQQVVSSKSAMAQPDASAARMAHALLEGFPGQSGQTILVK
ncbi:DUF4136 domain-containing protein [Novosphingobium profundi]|uniref:DUF4136 domain-containing protein n=1 Tax=Novosphingobium profundi TaxID=1774954 RepID=UPI001BD9BF3F|nr:DUF4136 domain-containing protein [Novosphingobium profundi]MBT0667263.1 DUF4136 domain-containing protein [Novosphingobium profundi]